MESNSTSKKRQREGNGVSQLHSNEDPRETKRVDTKSMEDKPEDVDSTLISSLRAKGADSKIPPCRFRLEAIFFPKFDNESRSDQSIRHRIKELVASGCGYAEASLKHSGCKFGMQGIPMVLDPHLGTDVLTQ